MTLEPVADLTRDELVRELAAANGKPESEYDSHSIGNLRRMVESARLVVKTAAMREAANRPMTVAPPPVQTAPAIIDYERLADAVLPRIAQHLGRELQPADMDKLSTTARLSPPERDPLYTFPCPEVLARWDSVARSGRPMRARLLGPTGSGKTTLAQQFAAEHNRPLLVVNCGDIIEASDWWATVQVKDATSYYQLTPLVEALQTPDAVIILDELNRVQSLKALNALFPALDHRGWVDLPTGERVHVAEGVVWFATVNEGLQYTATEQVDLAIRNRFERQLTVPYLSPSEEAAVLTRYGAEPTVADALVLVANNLRGNDHPISIRTMRACIEEMQFGATMGEALLLTYPSASDDLTDKELRAAAAAAINGIQFPNTLH